MRAKGNETRRNTFDLVFGASWLKAPRDVSCDAAASLTIMMHDFVFAPEILGHIRAHGAETLSTIMFHDV